MPDAGPSVSGNRLVSGTCVYCGGSFARAASSPSAVLYCSSEHRKAAANDRQRRNWLARIAQDDPRIARLLAEEEAWAAHKVRERAAVTAAEQAVTDAKAAAERAELERLARCPRRDKAAWQTREAVADVIKLMRAAKRPRSENLHPYLCDGCGAWHAGDRTAYESWQAKLEGTA